MGRLAAHQTMADGRAPVTEALFSWTSGRVCICTMVFIHFKLQEIKKMVDFMLLFDIIAKKVADIIKAF